MDRFLENLNELRMIVLMENEEGRFEQIMLNQDQYKRLGLLSGKRVREKEYDMKPEMQVFQHPINDDISINADLLIGAQSYYPQEMIDEAMSNPRE